MNRELHLLVECWPDTKAHPLHTHLFDSKKAAEKWLAVLHTNKKSGGQFVLIPLIGEILDMPEAGK